MQERNPDRGRNEARVLKPKETSDAFVPESWFQTPVWARKVVDHKRINAHILAVLRQLEAATSPVTRSNVGGWHSHDHIHVNEDLEEITKIIGTTCVGCAQYLEFDFDRFNLVITQMWLNKNGPGDFNKAHIHPNAILSGAYYVKTPDRGGNIELYDPVPARPMTVYPVKKLKPANSQTVEYKSEEGLLLVFPSWLLHSVQPNRSDEFRVSISFNIGFQQMASASTYQRERRSSAVASPLFSDDKET
jgi:uncharacterized protein (TIGR02466 family)